jgi:predicted NBD/HSP70 family sugar kinase
VPGPVDKRTGMLHAGSILASWAGADVAGGLSKRLGLPVFMDNDANLGALAEMTLGLGGGAEVLLYVLLSVGVGLGIGIDGQVFRGAGGIAGELGHVVIDDMGPLCRCGNRGCLESKVSVNTLRDAMRDGHGPVSVKDFLQMALDRNIGAQRIIGAAAGQVGRLVGDLCNYFNPDVVLVGGELSAAGDIVLNPLRDSLRRYAIARARENVRVQRGARAADRAGSAVGREDRIASSGSAISGRVSCDSRGLRRHFLPPPATRLPGFERALRSPST